MMGKFLNVDVLETLDAIAKQVLVSDWETFAYIKTQIVEAAHSKEPEQRVLLWICCMDDTELYQESDTLDRGTPAYEDVQYFQADNRYAQVPVYYEIELLGEKCGIVRGNIYAVDSRRYAALTKDAMPLHPVNDQQIESVREFHVTELCRMRQALPSRTLDAHLEKWIQVQINSEAKRLIACIRKAKKPSGPLRLHYVASVSKEFLSKASSRDIDQLITKLRKELQSPSLLMRNFGKENTPHILQPCYEHGRRKRSVKEKLAAKPIPGDYPAKPDKPKGQEER